MVNITDFNDSVVPVTQNVLKAIFERQEELMMNYKGIYLNNGFQHLVMQHPVDLHSAKGQSIIKHYYACTIEELAEAQEAFDDGNIIHGLEEIIDALHFFVEASIYAGIDAYEKDKDGLDNFDWVEKQSLEKRGFSYNFYNFTKYFGIAMNCLKQKPWKQNHILTDVNKFRAEMTKAWLSFTKLLLDLDLTKQDVLSFYFKKSEVNKFRQGSKY